MAIKWTRTPRPYAPNAPQYDARVGHLFVRVQDNGEGWFNWTVSLADMGVANEEDASIREGGASNERKAKQAVRIAVRQIVSAMECDL